MSLSRFGCLSYPESDYSLAHSRGSELGVLLKCLPDFVWEGIILKRTVSCTDLAVSNEIGSLLNKITLFA